MSADLPVLLVLASTYPRWLGDHEPGFVHELSKRLTRHFTVVALCPSAPGTVSEEVMDGVSVVRYRYAPRRMERLVSDGGIVENLRRDRWKLLLIPGFVLGQAWWAWRLMRTRKIQFVHAHWLIPQGLIAAFLTSLPGTHMPYVVTSHGADLFALRGRMLDWLKRFVVRRAAAVTVVSGAMRDTLRNIGADTSKVAVLPMGVDLATRFTPDHDVPRASNELLFVGRLVEKKGLRHLIQAMPAILQRRPDVTLTIVGFGPEEAASRDLAEALGVSANVSFVGAVKQEELPALYRRAAVFVAPFVQAASGDQEGLGLVLVEALGCGCRVVVSDLPATREVDGSGSLIRVPPGDPRLLAESILASLDHEHSPVPPVAIKTFDWSSRAAAYATLLRSAMGVRH
ncbi:glycosyltransferase [Pseudoxanthomonas sp. CCNWLW206]